MGRDFMEMEQFKHLLLEKFGSAVRFIGLQGSRARKEASEDSDIDIVVIFDRLPPERIEAYRLFLETMPQRDKICGFISGEAELKGWDKGELFQFCRDTIPVYGDLNTIVSFSQKESAEAAVHAGACAVYHGSVHAFVHGDGAAAVKEICKSAVFLMQADYFCKTGRYMHKHSDLYPHLGREEQQIMEAHRKLKEGNCSEEEMQCLCLLLTEWSSRFLRQEKRALAESERGTAK